METLTFNNAASEAMWVVQSLLLCFVGLTVFKVGRIHRVGTQALTQQRNAKASVDMF